MVGKIRADLDGGRLDETERDMPDDHLKEISVDVVLGAPSVPSAPPCTDTASKTGISLVKMLL